MEEQKKKHVCKFCKKSFPCGRSLGGHIRSHLPKPGYELRENPKKTWRSVAAADVDHHNEEDHNNTMINSSFSSSSAETENPKPRQVNQNHDKRSRNNSQSSVSEVVEAEHQEEQQEEVVVAMCLIMLSRDVGSWGGVSCSFAAAATASAAAGCSENNNSKSSNKSSRRRREKVQGNVSVSAAAADKKHESAASGCLHKGLKMKGIEVTVNGFGSNDQINKSKIMKMESLASGFVKDGVKIKEFQVLENGISSYDQNKQTPESKRKFIGQSAASGSGKKASKMLEFEVSENGISSYDQKNSDYDVLDSEIYSSSMSKRSKFECTTCNKVFHSYQALGGHRASHKKNGGGIKCSPPLLKLEAETDIAGNDGVSLSPDPQKQPQPRQELVSEVGVVIGSSSSPSKKVVQRHECPICYRVFPSGQALGGHKRSHLLVSSTNTEVKINNQTRRITDVVERLSSKEITRDLLDLNFPPALVHDEITTTTTTTTTTTVTTTPSSSTSLVGFMKPYWCVESSHKHEQLLGLISN